MIKEVKSHKMRASLGNDERIYAKSFHGATVKCMESYVQPSLERESDLCILHVGTNDLRSEKSAQSIANNITNLALDMKKG